MTDRFTCQRRVRTDPSASPGASLSAVVDREGAGRAAEPAPSSNRRLWNPRSRASSCHVTCGPSMRQVVERARDLLDSPDTRARLQRLPNVYRSARPLETMHAYRTLARDAKHRRQPLPASSAATDQRRALRYLLCMRCCTTSYPLPSRRRVSRFGCEGGRLRWIWTTGWTLLPDLKLAGRRVSPHGSNTVR